MAVHPSGQHGAAGNKNGGNVQPGRRHQQAGDVLVAVGHHDQSVKGVGQRHGFGGVGDQIPCDQRVFHTHMPHGDTVADGDGGENDGGAASHGDAQLNGLNNLVQIHVAGDDFVVGADDADQGTIHLFVGDAQCVEQGAVGGALCTFGDGVTSHK